MQQRLLHVQKQVKEIRQKHPSTMNTEQIIDNANLLIKHLRDIEGQIRANLIQPISDYGRLILDCQVNAYNINN